MARKEYSALLPVACSCALILVGASNAEGQSAVEQSGSPSARAQKAYKTLNFWDTEDTVRQKLTAILGRGAARYPYNLGEKAWISFFNTIPAYESFKTSGMQAFRDYLTEKIGVDAVVGENEVISVECFQFGTFSTGKGTGALGVVEVDYKRYDTPDLISTFKKAFSGAREMEETRKIACPRIPGASLEFQRTFFIDTNSDRRAILSVPTGKVSFKFTGLSQMSPQQQAAWQQLMTQNGKTNLIEYFAHVKAILQKAAKQMQDAGKPDGYFLAMLGIVEQPGYPPDDFESAIYGPPTAVFASRKILDPILHGYYQSIADEARQNKIKLQQEIKAASGF